MGWALMEGTHQLTGHHYLFGKEKEMLATIPGTPVHLSDFCATNCLAYCSCTSHACAKLSVCWVGGSVGAGVINLLNVPSSGVAPEKLGARITHVPLTRGGRRH